MLMRFKQAVFNIDDQSWHSVKHSSIPAFLPRLENSVNIIDTTKAHPCLSPGISGMFDNMVEKTRACR